ncbi:MAG: class I SAM-dependent methyltransferase [Bacteroidales bacterium]
MENLQQCPLCQNQERSIFLKTRDWFLTQQDFNIEQCDNCGFLFTNPRPEPHKTSDYYKSENYISHNSEKKGLVSLIYRIIRHYSLKQKYQHIKKHTSGKSILDIGSGTGEFLNFMKINNWRVKGIEPDQKARDFSVQRYKLPVDDEPELEQIPAGSFDVITMWHVLEHVPDLTKKIHHLKNILNQNGLLIIAVPNPDAFDAAYYEKYWAAWDVPRHLYHFRKENIRSLAQQANMNVKEIVPMVFDAYYISLLSEKYRSSKPNYLNAFLTGLKSNWKARKNCNHSSLIYILGNPE